MSKKSLRAKCSKKDNFDSRGYCTTSTPSANRASETQHERKTTHSVSLNCQIAPPSSSLSEPNQTHNVAMFTKDAKQACPMVLPEVANEVLEALIFVAVSWQRKSKLLTPELRWITSELADSALKDADHEVFDSATFAQNILTLSHEQREVVVCPRSVFIQGRAGTGKTVILIQRILAAQGLGDRHERYGSSMSHLRDAVPRSLQNGGPKSIASHLYVTKSSSLCQSVASQLRAAGCDISLPNTQLRGTMCLTWAQLVRLLGVTYPQALVRYEVFLWKYWPHLKSGAPELSAQLVWAEFNTRLRPFGPVWLSGLSRGEYLSSNVSAIGVELSKAQQAAIYDMFCQYTDLKERERNVHRHRPEDQDDVDVAVSVARIIGYPDRHFQKFETVYIDEAQDFSPCELTLLFALCHNPAGVSVAGDTCQTINPGSAFHFSHIVKQFRDPWSMTNRQQRQLGLKHTLKLRADNKPYRESAQNSGTFMLRHNYRCAAGVSELASSVSRLLVDRFAHSVDCIEEEILVGMGSAKPLLVELIGEDPGKYIMGTGSHRASQVDWAHVIFLVSTDRSRQRLRTSGVQGTILTIEEAKGLEFDLVVLCGVLADCPDNWLRWALADPCSDVSRAASRVGSAQQLSVRESYVVQEAVLGIIELKRLYVAITRARVGCAILEWEGPPSAWAPLLQLWQRAKAIECWSGVEVYKSRVLHTCGSTSLSSSAGAPELPSLVTVLERRFDCQRSEGDMVELPFALQKKGFQLLAHAVDNPQDRCHVFEEARQTLIRALSVSDLAMDSQLSHNKKYSLLEVFSDANESTLSRWRKQICTVVKEICRGRSQNWRGSSTLRVLPSLRVWALVFAFLVPGDVTDVQSQVFQIAAMVKQQLSFQQETRTKILFAHGWTLLGQIRYVAYQRKATIEANVKMALLSLGRCEGMQEKEDLVGDAVLQLLALHDLCKGHADTLMEAGRAYLAANSPQLAASAFTEAADATETMPALLWNCTPPLRACNACRGKIETIEEMPIPLRCQQDRLQPLRSWNWDRYTANLTEPQSRCHRRRWCQRLPNLRADHCCLNHGGLLDIWAYLSATLKVSFLRKMNNALNAARCLSLWLECDTCADDLREEALICLKRELRLAGFA